MRRYMLIILMCLAGVLIAGCDVIAVGNVISNDDSGVSTPQSPYTLEQIYYARYTVDDLVARGILSQQEADAQYTFYDTQTQMISGEVLSQADIETMIFSTPADRWWRVVTFVNLLWLAGSVMIVLALGVLFYLYIYPILKKIPVWFYELLAYAACAGLVVVGRLYFEPDVGQFVAMPAVLALIGLLPFSYQRYFVPSRDAIKSDVDPEMDPEEKQAQRKQRAEDDRAVAQRLALALTLIWGGIAIWYDSQLIGVLAFAEFIVLLTISNVVSVLLDTVRLGRRDDIVWRVLVVTFAVLVVYITGEILDWSGVYRVFEWGVYWIGTYFFFLMLEIKSSLWYSKKRKTAYVWWQVIAIAISLILLFIGVVWELDAVQETSGTFLVLHLFVKYVELLNWRRQWAWGLLGLGALLYCLGLVVNQYPEFFLFVS